MEATGSAAGAALHRGLTYRAPGLYAEHDLFIQLTKLKNTLRFLAGEELVTHLGLEYYDYFS
jgi:hypothetical protein